MANAPLWTIQQLIQLIKDDLELHDLPNTITDEMIIERIRQSSLKDFSIVYPRFEKFRISYNDLVNPEIRFHNRSRGLEYYIPKHFLIQYTPITLIDVEPYTHKDFYGDVLPYALGYEPAGLITDIAGIKGMAGMAANLANSPTPDYDSARQIITIYNGYTEGLYEVTMGVAHDINLRTIPTTAMVTFRELATNDVGAYIYSKIFRKDGIDTGVGNITLNIDNLRECKSKYKDLMKELADEAVLDIDTIEFF